MADPAKDPEKTALILCNLGARDVQRRAGGALQGLYPARPRGQEAWEHYDGPADSLALPILEPVITFIASLERARPLRVVLLGTDQDDERHREKDTLFFARIAARRLPELFGEDLVRPEVVLIQRINPALYDEAYEFFDRLLQERRGPQVAVCYAVLAGGIPALNAALLVQGVRHFGERFQAIYPPEGEEPQALRIGRQLLAAFHGAAAAERLEALDFAGALPGLAGIDAGRRGLVEYAARRLEFDFQAAQAALERALADGDAPTRAFIRKNLRHSLDRLREEAMTPARLAALLRELYWTAEIAYRGGRWTDFLGRIYRFQEAALRYLVESIFHLPTDLDPAVRAANQAAWEAGIQALPGLRAYLEAGREDDRPLDWRVIARPAYKKLLAYALDPPTGRDAAGQPLVPQKDQGRLEALVKRANSLDGLVELRHRSILGHGFAGVSRASVQAASPERHRADPPAALAEILRMMGEDLQENPYAAIARFVGAGL